MVLYHVQFQDNELKSDVYKAALKRVAGAIDEKAKKTL